MPLTPLSGTLDLKRAAHLLRRATFGATKDQIDSFVGLNAATAVQRLFRPTTPLPDPKLPVDLKTGQEWLISGTNGNSSELFQLESFFVNWMLGQMMSPGITDSNTSLAYSTREKLVFFLHTHFTTIRSKVSNTRALFFQNKLFRMFALDDNNTNPDLETNFKNLTVKISVDNAMLAVLDGNTNSKNSVNENYARELLELYSIGRGLEGKSLGTSTGDGDYIVYTEDDVKAAARVLSGWQVAMPENVPYDETQPSAQFGYDEETKLPRGKVKGSVDNASAHDNSTKQFSARMGSKTIAPDQTLLNNGNATEASALDEISQLIDLIYEQEETHRNICRKIYRFFVYATHNKYEAGNDTAIIEDTIITEMKNTFVASGFKIQPVIEELLCSQHFYDATSIIPDDNFGGIIKSPIDLIIGTLRFFEVQLPDPEAQPEEFNRATSEILGGDDSGIQGLGINFYEPYDVAGYEAYHQFPIYHRYWITPNSLARRYQFIRLLFADSGSVLKVNAYEYTQRNFSSVAADAEKLIAEIAKYVFPVPDKMDFDEATDSGLTAKRMAYFKLKFFQDNSFDQAYWAGTWGPPAKGEVNDWLANLYNIMLQTPEYQLF